MELSTVDNAVELAPQDHQIHVWYINYRITDVALGETLLLKSTSTVPVL